MDLSEGIADNFGNGIRDALRDHPANMFGFSVMITMVAAMYANRSFRGVISTFADRQLFSKGMLAGLAAGVVSKKVGVKAKDYIKVNDVTAQTGSGDYDKVVAIFAAAPFIVMSTLGTLPAVRACTAMTGAFVSLRLMGWYDQSHT